MCTDMHAGCVYVLCVCVYMCICVVWLSIYLFTHAACTTDICSHHAPTNPHTKPPQVRLLSPTHLDAQPRCVLPRKVGVQYTVEHWGGWLLMLTNAHSSRGPVVSTPTTSPVEEGDHGGEHEGEKQEGNGVKREGEHARTHHDVGMQMGGEYGGGGDGGYVIMCCPAPTHHEMQGGATLANRDPHHAGSPPTHPPTHTTTTTNTMASQNHEGPKEKTAGEQCEGGNVAPPWCVSTEQWGLVVDPGQDGVIVQHVDVMEDMYVVLCIEQPYCVCVHCTTSVCVCALYYICVCVCIVLHLCVHIAECV